MSNNRLTTNPKLQGQEPFLEIRDVNSDNFIFDANDTLNLANSLTVNDLTVDGDLTLASGSNVVASTLTTSTSLTTPKLIFTDNASTGLTIEAGDGADYMTFDSTNGSEHIDILKDINTGGNKLTMGTNGSRGQIQYSNLKNSTIDNTNTCSLNTTGTCASWTSSRTITCRNSGNGDATMGSVAINGTGDVNLDINVIDESNSNAHKLIIKNTQSGHTDTNIQQRIDFINPHDSNITRSDDYVGKIASLNDNMIFTIYDKSHSSNSSLLQLTKNIADDIPTMNSFLHFSTQADGERFINIENNNTTYDDTTARRQYPTSIHLGNAGNYKDTVVGNTIAKIQANWRADGQGQLKILARQNTSSSAHECGFLISDDTGGGTALDVPLTATDMVMKGVKLGAIHDVDYFNGMKVGHGAMVGNGLQILASGGSVVSGAPSAYGNAIHPKLKTDGGLAVDGDGLYATIGGEWSGSGSNPEKILAENKRAVANSGDNTTFDFNYGGTERNSCNSYHTFGTSKSDATNAVNAGLQIFSNNESDGGDGATSSLMLRTRTENDGDSAVKTDVSVMLTNNNGEIALASSHFSADDSNTTGGVFGGTGLTNRSSAIHHDRMLFGKNGGIILSPQAKTADDNSIDDVYAQFRDNYALSGTGLGELSIYNGSVGAGINLLSGISNMTGGTDLGGTPITTPNGFSITYSTSGVATINNKKAKEIVFKVNNAEKMRIDDNGYIGIANSSPEVPLSVGAGATVAGNALPTNYNQSYYVNAHGHGGLALGVIGDLDASSLVSDINTSTLYISIYAYGNILSYFGFMWGSDERMKCEIEELDDTEALDIIKAIETKKYHYKDLDKRNPTKTIGFIAQDVKKVFPNAIQEKSAYVPDEGRAILNPLWEEVIIDDETKWKLTIDDIDWEVNHTGKCQFIMLDNGREDKHIRVEEDKKSFLFDEKFEKIWFFGKQIKDFHHLDKAQIFALHHSGIQQLCKINDDQAIKNNELENNVTELENKINTLETENNTLLIQTQSLSDQNIAYEARIQTLENQLSELITRVTFNENALKGLM